MAKSGLQMDWKPLQVGFQNFFKKIKMEQPGGADETARIKVGLQLLNWVLNGSSKVSVVPPVKDGILRGSGSVFVGGKFVGDTKGQYPGGTPNKSFNGPKDAITIGFNTAYAAKMHERLSPAGNLKLGPVSLQSGDVGGKFIQAHLAGDGKAAIALYALLLKKGTGG